MHSAHAAGHGVAASAVVVWSGVPQAGAVGAPR
jgi:hypothetical protein